MKVPFARADGDALGSIASAVEAKNKNNRPTGEPKCLTSKSMLLHVNVYYLQIFTLFSRVRISPTWWQCSSRSNLINLPNCLKLQTVEEVTAFIASRNSF